MILNPEKRYRIAHFCFSLDFSNGGTPQAIKNLVLKLSEKEVDNFVVSMGNHFFLRKELRVLESEFSSKGTELFLNYSIFRNKYGFGGVLALRRFWKESSSYNIIVLHQIFSLSTLFGYFYAKSKRIPYFIVPHGSLMTESYSKNKFIKEFASFIILKRIIKDSKSLIVTSPLEGLETSLRFPHKINQIYFGVDAPELSHFSNPQFERHLQDEYIIFAGRFDNIKNLDVLLQAIPLVLRVFPKLKLLLIGSGSKYQENRMLLLVQSLEIENSVDFLGWLERKDLHLLIASSRVVVLPSSGENFSLVVAESIALGVPCIVSSRVGLAELIKKYNAGDVLLDITPEVLANSIIVLLGSETLNFKENARRAYEGELAWEKVLDAWIELLKQS